MNDDRNKPITEEQIIGEIGRLATLIGRAQFTLRCGQEFIEKVSKGTATEDDIAAMQRLFIEAHDAMEAHFAKQKDTPDE